MPSFSSKQVALTLVYGTYKTTEVLLSSVSVVAPFHILNQYSVRPEQTDPTAGVPSSSKHAHL